MFSRDGEWFVPSALATGPWRPDAMHGGPPSGLLAYVIEAVAEPDERIARINVELERPVPIEPLNAKVERRKVSRRVARIDVQLWSATAQVASARAVLLSSSPVPAVFDDGGPLVVPGVEAAAASPGAPYNAPIAFHQDAVEFRVVEGGFGVPGPSVIWMRLRPRVVRGEDTSGLCQLMSLADFGSPMSQNPPEGVSVAMINIDVNVTMHRTPTGPWFRLAARSRIGPEGVGLAVTELSDVAGVFGVTTQTQIAQPLVRQ